MGFLHLYDESGSSIWKSGESYGESDISVQRPNFQQGDPGEYWFVRGRLIAIKTERGQEVFVVRKIPNLNLIPGSGSKEAEVYSLWWDGITMEKTPVLKGLPGSVNDYWITGNGIFLISRGNFLNLLKNSMGGEFSKGSMIYYYNIKGK
jgi:hypothetical protein